MANISFHFLSKHLQIPHGVLDTVWSLVVQRYRDTIHVVRGELLTPARIVDGGRGLVGIDEL